MDVNFIRFSFILLTPVQIVVGDISTTFQSIELFIHSFIFNAVDFSRW